ncbi:MAG: hypothetical protein AAFV95_22535 [Bacteroidota bacterium]
MKSFKTLFTAILIALISQTAFAQVAEKTLVKSFNLKGQQLVVLNLEGDVQVQEWNNDIMRIQMGISIPNVHTTTLKSLVQAGRYHLRSKVEEDSYLVYAPGLEKEVKIRGQKLNEKITYTVYAPRNVLVKMADEASTSNAELGTKMPSSL